MRARHFVMTRSSYNNDWPMEANRARLALLAGVTAPSLLAQTNQRFEWVVVCDRTDPLLKDREAAIRSAGVKTRIIYQDQSLIGMTKKEAAQKSYKAGWAGAIDAPNGNTFQTRLDDDDALAPHALERVRELGRSLRHRSSIILPDGLRAADGLYTPVRHETNAMATLITLDGDPTTVYDFGHMRVAEYAQVVMDESGEVGWLWTRHENTISRMREVTEPITQDIMGKFPGVDWSLLGV